MLIVWVYVVLMTVLGGTQAFAMRNLLLLDSILGLKTRGALSHMIFCKAIRLQSSGGTEVLNLMSSVLNRIFMAAFVVDGLVWSMAMIVLVFIKFSVQIGAAGASTILVALALTPVNMLLAKWVGTSKLME